ncbi:MAG TPA: hypothetical protein VJP79_00320, partial [Nitrososphaera sp.]|nr:hypothetical protein [Nitrososphaera sp.]
MTSKNKSLIRSGSTAAIAAMLLVVPALFLATYAGQPADAGGGTTTAASDSMTMDGSSTMGNNNDGIMSMVAKKNYSSFRGQISNVQLDKAGQPEWIQSGIWVLRISQEDEDATSPQYGFTARIMMVKPDGSAPHSHAIYGIKVTGHDVNGTMHSLMGTANMGMPSGTVADVPIRINLINDAVIALWIGPDKVDGHFGSNPIYGTLAMSRSAAKMEMDQMMMMATEVPKLTETSLPVTIPLTKGFVDGAEVFYISTEASDKDLADHLTEFTGFRVAYAPSLTRTPQSALANIYAFSNGIEGSGPLGFQPSVADSKPGDSQYSPLWRINMVEWRQGTTP